MFNSRSFTFGSNTNSEHQMKLFHERITLVEKHFGDLCSLISEYSTKIAKLRNKNDELVKAFEAMAANELIEKSFGENSAKLATILATIGDRLHQRAMSIDSNVVYELSSYQKICRNVREEIRVNSNVRDREALKKRQMDKLRNRSQSRQQMSQTELDYLKAITEFDKSSCTLDEQADNFEKRKLHDFKSIILSFLTTEIRYNAYALELLTQGYNHIASISESEDLEGHQKSLPQFHFQVPNIQKAQSLGSLMETATTSHRAPSNYNYNHRPLRKPFMARNSSNLNRKKSVSIHLIDDHNYGFKDDDNDNDGDDDYNDTNDDNNDDINGNNRVSLVKLKSPSDSISSEDTIEGIPDFTIKRHKK